MSECFSKFFINNGNLMNSENFRDEMVREGKSIYEVVRVINGIPLFIERHIERFKNSAALINKQILINDKEILENIRRLIKEENVTYGNIKFVNNYRDEENKYYFYFISHSYPSDELYRDGVHTVLYHGERENPNAKVINGLFRSKVEALIKEKSAYEAILVDNDGFITEGSKSNIFMVKGDTVITSPVEAVLPGVTRGVILSILEEADISYKEEQYHYKDINKLDGLFISGTSPKVLPIKTVDDFIFNSSENEIIKEIKNLYDKKVENYIQKNTIE